MGQLQNLVVDRVVATELVKVSERGGFEVRGLSPYDIIAMFLRHRGELSGLFDQVIAKVKGGQAITEDMIMGMMTGALETSPLLIAEIVSLGCGNDPKAEDWQAEVAVARTLPISVQTDALGKIANLTFTSEMPLGKFVAVVLGAMQSATAMLQENSQPVSNIGSGNFDAK